MEEKIVAGSTHKRITQPRKINILVSVIAGFVVLTALVTLVASFAKNLPVLINQQFSTAGAAETFTNPLDAGTWQVADGAYTLTQPAVATATDIGNTNLSINKTAIKASVWELTANAKSSSDFSIVFDYVDSLNYAYASFGTQPSSTVHAIFKVENGVQTKLADIDKSKLAKIVAGQNYRIELRKKGADVRLFADVDGKKNQFLAKVTTKTLPSSKVGFGSRGGQATFDNLLVSGQGGVATPNPSPGPTPAPTPTPPTTTNPPTAPPLTTTPEGGRAVRVTNGTELEAALANAQPADVITMADGVYTAKGSPVNLGAQVAASKFRIEKSGTPSKPIVLQGTRQAVINGKPGGDGTGGDYGLHLYKANYWVIKGIRITNNKKGIMLDGSHRNTLDGVMVDTVGHEGVHFRTGSSDNVLKNSFITKLGYNNPNYGEGVYIGSSDNNWGLTGTTVPDRANRNEIVGNTITEFTAEGIDLKEAVSKTIIKGNFFDGAGTGLDPGSGTTERRIRNSGDSWIDVKGNDNLITENSGVNVPLLDKSSAAFQTHVHGPSGYESASNNKFTLNKVISGNEGFGFWIDKNGKGNVVSCSNIILSAAKGFVNAEVGGACRETGN